MKGLYNNNERSVTQHIKVHIVSTESYLVAVALKCHTASPNAITPTV